MRLLAIDIQQLPGIEAFRVDGFAAGANLITGPNAVGKSSLVRGLRYLVSAPSAADPSALALEALFEDEHGQWRARRTGSQLSWTRNGEPADAPPLPDADLLHCYWLRVEDLLSAAGEDDRRLVTRLRRELSGGFDLQAVRRSVFEFGPRLGQKEAADLSSASKRRQQIESGYQALLKEADRRPALEAEARQARAADTRARLLEQALSLLEARRQRERIEAEQADFPKGMDRLRGNELQRLEELEGDRSRCHDAIEGQRRIREEASASLHEAALATAWPTDADLQAHRARLGEARGLSTRMADRRQQLDKQVAAERQAGSELGGTEDTPPALTPEHVGQCERLADALLNARARAAEQRAKLAAFDTGHAESPRDPLRAQLPWLGALTAAAGGVAAGASILTALWSGFAAAVVVIAAGVWLLIATRIYGGAHQQRLEAELRARQHANLQAQVDAAEEALEEQERKQQAFCEQRGLDPALLAGSGLDRFVRLAAELDRARAERRSIEAEIERMDSDVHALAQQVHGFLDQWQAAHASAELTDLESGLDAFAHRCRQAAEARAAHARAAKEEYRQQDTLGAVEKRIRELYENAGLAPEDRLALEQRCARHGAWQTWTRRLDEAISIENERRSPLTDHAELLERVDADHESGLGEELEEQRAFAASHEDLQRQLNSIQTRLEEAGKDGELEQALARENAAGEELRGLFDRAMVSAAGRFLLNQVADEYQTQHEPGILRDARTRFERFTHHGWSLEIDAEHGFQARNNASGERRRLAELSSGTRMQLLLAVRVAWARQIEREKTALPLFLDEALTTSDEARFCEVAASLHQLVCDEDRQVFYLSARREEIGLWTHATGARPHVVDLAVARLGGREASAADYVLPPPERLPEPQGYTAAQYAAAIGVPPVQPNRPAEALHLFHLCRDDLPLLYRLMEHWRLRSLGELEALLAGDAAAAAIPEPAIRRALRQRCDAARTWAMLWRQGRGKPVDRGVLEAAGAVKATFIEQVAALADQLHGDGEALIAALRERRVPRFRRQATDELETWLTAQGHIDSATPLTSEQRLQRTVWRLGDQAEPVEVIKVVRWLDTETEAGASGTAISERGAHPPQTEAY